MPCLTSLARIRWVHNRIDPPTNPQGGRFFPHARQSVKADTLNLQHTLRLALIYLQKSTGSNAFCAKTRQASLTCLSSLQCSSIADSASLWQAQFAATSHYNQVDTFLHLYLLQSLEALCCCTITLTAPVTMTTMPALREDSSQTVQVM